MLASADERTTVIAVDLDRLLRHPCDLVDLIATKARVLTVDGELDLTTADGEFRATMLAGIARFEVRRKGERQVRVPRGARHAEPGKRRYGYEVDGTTPRHEEAAVVRRIFEHIASGGSVRSIALALSEEQVDPGTARAWRPGRVREIANNPHYAVAMRYQDQVIESEHITRIVAPELAAEVRAILADPSRRTTPGSAPRHLASSGAAIDGTPPD